MIFRFDDSLKGQTDEVTYDIAKLLLSISNLKHNVSCGAELWKWLEDTVMSESNIFLGKKDLDRIKHNAELRNITAQKEKFMSTVTIGYKNGMLTPSEVLEKINIPSEVIVENAENDWKVISKWIELMKNQRKYKNINQIVCKRKDRDRLCAYNAGSSGQIVNTIHQRCAFFKKNAPFKVSVIYDSDKESKTCEMKQTQKNIIRAVRETNIVGHMLMKREMENYFPENIYRKVGFILETTSIPRYTEEDWDFWDLQHSPYTKAIGEKEDRNLYTKKDLPKLADYLDKYSLLQRVSNNTMVYKDESVDEIQMIILELAKIC